MQGQPSIPALHDFYGEPITHTHKEVAVHNPSQTPTLLEQIAEGNILFAGDIIRESHVGIVHGSPEWENEVKTVYKGDQIFYEEGRFTLPCGTSPEAPLQRIYSLQPTFKLKDRFVLDKYIPYDVDLSFVEPFHWNPEEGTYFVIETEDISETEGNILYGNILIREQRKDIAFPVTYQNEFTFELIRMDKGWADQERLAYEKRAEELFNTKIRNLCLPEHWQE